MNTTTTPALRQRGRPRSESPRDIGVLLKLSKEEIAIIEKKAAGKPRAQWIREVALAA